MLHKILDLFKDHSPKIIAAINWKVAIAIILAIVMLFTPKWIDQQIMSIERIFQIPVIDLGVEGVPDPSLGETKECNGGRCYHKGS